MSSTTPLVGRCPPAAHLAAGRYWTRTVLATGTVVWNIERRVATGKRVGTSVTLLAAEVRHMGLAVARRYIAFRLREARRRINSACSLLRDTQIRQGYL